MVNLSQFMAAHGNLVVLLQSFITYLFLVLRYSSD